ncbi:MAG: hypothetical protein P8M25_03260 [Paracoccaceae bacterium]|nr:hypothetical protein [Paracoccaceae bacterium]
MTDFEVLQWTQAVRSSRAQRIVAMNWQSLINFLIYISTDALAHLAKLRKGPVLAALYVIVVLI